GLAGRVRGAGAADPPRAGARQAARPRREGARTAPLPHAAPAARLAAGVRRLRMNGDVQLILVSNRGPATFEHDEAGELSAHRGGGGLVTALTGLVHHREALWIASTLTEADAEVSRRHGGGSFDCDVDGTRYRLRL